MERRFAAKVAFVTGGTTGIGQATAVRLASEGALVGVNRRPSDDPTETVRQIKEVGGEGFPVVADVRDPAKVEGMARVVAQRGGRLDYVVSNAGINPFMKWDETSSIIAFLLSDDASYLTSTTLLADAGFIVNAEL